MMVLLSYKKHNSQAKHVISFTHTQPLLMLPCSFGRLVVSSESLGSFFVFLAEIKRTVSLRFAEERVLLLQSDPCWRNPCSAGVWGKPIRNPTLQLSNAPLWPQALQSIPLENTAQLRRVLQENGDFWSIHVIFELRRIRPGSKGHVAADWPIILLTLDEPHSVGGEVDRLAGEKGRV